MSLLKQEELIGPYEGVHEGAWLLLVLQHRFGLEEFQLLAKSFGVVLVLASLVQLPLQLNLVRIQVQTIFCEVFPALF